MNISRREMISLGVSALAGAVLAPGAIAAAAPGPSPVEVPVGAAWPEHRKKIERGWLDLLGEFPREVPPLQPVVREVAHENGVTRYHVSFQAEADDRVTAWLLVPDVAKTRRVPAIVCLHSTTWGTGKDSTIGIGGILKGDGPEQWAIRYRNPDQGQAYGRDLAEHGFVTLSIDFLTDGERIRPGERIMDTRPFYVRHPGWSMVGKNIWDIQRSVDFLQTLDTVDPKQIGCIGWSLGGHMTVFAAAFEPRITAAANIGGVLDWHRQTNSWGRPDDFPNNPDLERRFGFKPNSGPYIYIKNFRPYIADQSLPLPADFDGLMMMVAPRPLLILSTEWEFYSHKITPKCLAAARVYGNWRDAPGLPSVVKARQERWGYDRTLAYYEFHNRVPAERIPGQLAEVGALDCFSWFSYPGGHGLPLVARGLSQSWFDRWLGRAPSA